MSCIVEIKRSTKSRRAAKKERLLEVDRIRAAKREYARGMVDAIAEAIRAGEREEGIVLDLIEKMKDEAEVRDEEGRIRVNKKDVFRDLLQELKDNYYWIEQEEKALSQFLEEAGADDNQYISDRQRKSDAAGAEMMRGIKEMWRSVTRIKESLIAAYCENS